MGHVHDVHPRVRGPRVRYPFRSVACGSVAWSCNAGPYSTVPCRAVPHTGVVVSHHGVVVPCRTVVAPRYAVWCGVVVWWCRRGAEGSEHDNAAQEIRDLQDKGSTFQGFFLAPVFDSANHARPRQLE